MQGTDPDHRYFRSLRAEGLAKNGDDEAIAVFVPVLNLPGHQVLSAGD